MQSLSQAVPDNWPRKWVKMSLIFCFLQLTVCFLRVGGHVSFIFVFLRNWSWVQCLHLRWARNSYWVELSVALGHPFAAIPGLSPLLFWAGVWSQWKALVDSWACPPFTLGTSYWVGHCSRWTLSHFAVCFCIISSCSRDPTCSYFCRYYQRLEKYYMAESLI